MRNLQTCRELLPGKRCFGAARNLVSEPLEHLPVLRRNLDSAVRQLERPVLARVLYWRHLGRHRQHFRIFQRLRVKSAMPIFPLLAAIPTMNGKLIFASTSVAGARRISSGVHMVYVKSPTKVRIVSISFAAISFSFINSMTA